MLLMHAADAALDSSSAPVGASSHPCHPPHSTCSAAGTSHCACAHDHSGDGNVGAQEPPGAGDNDEQDEEWVAQQVQDDDDETDAMFSAAEGGKEADRGKEARRRQTEARRRQKGARRRWMETRLGKIWMQWLLI